MCIRDRLYASLSPEEYRAAMESTLTAFYTPPVVLKGMYEALERLGFSEGSILEPSCGTDVYKRQQQRSIYADEPLRC